MQNRFYEIQFMEEVKNMTAERRMLNAERDYNILGQRKTYTANFSATAAIKTFYLLSLSNFSVRVRLIVSYRVRVRVYSCMDCTSADLVNCSRVLHSAFCKLYPPGAVMFFHFFYELNFEKIYFHSNHLEIKEHKVEKAKL